MIFFYNLGARWILNDSHVTGKVSILLHKVILLSSIFLDPHKNHLAKVAEM